MTQLAHTKPEETPPDPGDLARLARVRKAFIYQRHSTYEQRKKSLWSLEMQEAFKEQARSDGCRKEEITVERRDLGISGTKGWKERLGVAALI